MVSEPESSALRELIHEARTPLLALAAALDVAPPSPEMTMASTALAHLHELLLRAEDRAEGSTPASPVPVSLRTTTAEVGALVAPVLAARGVRLRVALDADRVLGDPLALRQILVNLITNAVRFTPAASEILLAARLEGDGTAVLEVHDQGPGVDPTSAEWIFGRGNSGSAPGGCHRGLGLFLARQLAEAMGGSLDVRGSDTGACFRLVLQTPKL